MKKIISVTLILSTFISVHTVCFGQNSSEIRGDDPSADDDASEISNYEPSVDSEFFENATTILPKNDGNKIPPPNEPDDDTTVLKVGVVISGTLLVTTIVGAITASAIIFKDSIKKFFCEDLKDFYEKGVKPAFTHGFKDFFKNLFKKKK